MAEFTLEALTPGRFRSRILDILRVKGKSEPVKVYEIYGHGDDFIDPRREEYYKAYERAYAAYMSRDFTNAADGFKKALILAPEDMASLGMIERMERIRLEDLPDDWDGSVRMTKK